MAPRRSLAALPLSLSLISGCAEELGPVDRPSTRVAGRVHLGDTPIGGGWIEFLPVEGTRGDLRSAPLDPEGRFEADGVAVGRVGIRLVNPPVRLDPRFRFELFTSPIRREIRPGEPIDLDLRAEQLEFLRKGGRR